MTVAGQASVLGIMARSALITEVFLHKIQSFPQIILAELQVWSSKNRENKARSSGNAYRTLAGNEIIDGRKNN